MRAGGPGRRAAAVLAAVPIVAASAGWVVTDRFERDNDFCNACHLGPGVPLHQAVRDDFETRPAETLAGAHAVAGVPGRDAGFRCIDCHGGTGLVGRARVKALAARDAFWYVVGHFEEPDGMRWPLWDEDCRKCHATFDEGAAGLAWQTPRFHQVPLHNVDLGVDCVSCHQSHEPGGNALAHFIHAESVRVQCARCHPELGE